MTAGSGPLILVAGGGPAGAAAALTLARAGRRVLLAEASGGPPSAGEALPAAARPLLRDLGVLERFLADGHLPCYGNVSAWGSDDARATDFLFDPNGHGWHLDRGRFDALLRAAARDAGAEVLPDVRLTGAARDGAGAARPPAGSRGGSRELSCAWLVDATGRRSAGARRAGATRLSDDVLIAFHARFRRAPGAADDRDARTLVEAAPDGWWYAALVPSGERIVAFLTDADLADPAALRSPGGFLARLAACRHVGALLPSHAMCGRPRAVAAGSARLDHFAGLGWVAVGDAAISFDPLSSQGLLTALFTGLRAGHAIGRALGGDAGPWERYPRQLEGIYAAYRRGLAASYAAELRWPDRPFWRRRTPPAGPVGVSVSP